MVTPTECMDLATSWPEKTRLHLNRYNTKPVRIRRLGRQGHHHIHKRHDDTTMRRLEAVFLMRLER
jgi:hypothetical protein